LFYLVPIYNTNATKVLQFNITDSVSTEIGIIPLSFEFASYVVDSDADIYVVGGYNFIDKIVKVNLD